MSVSAVEYALSMAQEALVHIVPGTKMNAWTIEEKLGEGGCSAVYKLSRQSPNGKEFYAMKTENLAETCHLLKMEANVLKLATADTRCRHLPKCLETGCFENFLYVVMTLTGQDLDNLRRRAKGRKFSMGCAISVGIQCLTALEELHSIGFLHRDVKPTNYAVGRTEVHEARHVYLLDFGMCRKYLDDHGFLRPPRMKALFKGTNLYASLSAHLRREQCRKDDLESWLYQQIELTRGALPWRSRDNAKNPMKSMDVVGAYKERCRFDPGLQELMGGCPHEYIEILRYLDGLGYFETPDYKKIKKLLQHALSASKLTEYPYDWEPPMRVTS
ncbi:Protein kinase domain containing protein [Aphelenchoides avenae]|nr:Protein kinase domain containing protein [Aphelenchus avenae]